jgi:hypothetical protein
MSMMVYVFWDASGLTKRYAFERGSEVVNLIFHLVPTRRMMCLLLTVGEVYRALVRKRNDGLIGDSSLLTNDCCGRRKAKSLQF